MKILTLNLEAFGPFTGLVLDLSRGSEGLHLIYGDNETGKSSALRALRGLLFGIPVRSTDNFRHQNKDLRIGARVRHSDGSELTFVRRKARKNSLVDPHGKALADTALVNYLGGVNEDLFSTLYGINHRELVQGGQDILAAKGDVGQSLFDAGMGGVSLRKVIESLDADAGELFKTRGKQRIDILVTQFKEVRSRRKTLSLSSRDWAEHDGALRTARKEKKAVVQELGKFRSEQEKVERIQKCLPLIAKRQAVLDEFDHFGRRFGSAPGAFGQQLVDNLAAARRDFSHHFFKGPIIYIGNGIHQVGKIIALERFFAGQQFIHHHTERKDI